MKIKEYIRPQSLEKACSMVQNENAVIIGGGTFLNLSHAEIGKALDLSEMGLDFIKEREGYVEIGGSTTLRKIEKSEIISKYFNGVISKTCSEIMGVQIRNAATIGGAVYGRFGFSDLITTLLALDAEIVLYAGGRMKLEEFLEGDRPRDILVKVLVKLEDCRSSYSNMRNSSIDFSILNVAVAKRGDMFSICVGARPGRAKLAYAAMEYMNSGVKSEEAVEEAGRLAAEELEFSSDIRGSLEYRQEICRVLVKRCIMEVLR